MTARQVHDRRAAGLLVPVHQGVYRLAGSPRSWNQDVLAACMAAGPTAVASHRAAAWLWGLRGADQVVPETRLPGVVALS